MPLALRAWLRYLVPLTLLGALACGPILAIALRAPAVQDIPHARMQLRVPWLLASFAWVCQLWLVAGVAPAVRSVATAQPLSQLAALWAGLRGLVRGLVPVLVAVIAVMLGGVALAVPGIVLLVLLALTGASDELRAPLPAPLVDSIAAVRANWQRVAIALAVIVVVGLVAAFVAQKLYVPPIKTKLPPSKLLPLRTFVRVTGLALAALSTPAACVLASRYPFGRSQRSS